MLGYLSFSALAVQEGRSFMAGKIGKQVMSPLISIWDDGLDPDGLPMAFDFEGTPKERVDFIRQGIAVGVVYDAPTAAKAGTHSTGHSLPMPNAQGPFALNMHLGVGDASLEEMIGGMERGLLVTRFHYTRPVHPIKVVMTGMTRDGTFWIEKGEIAYPVKNLRFTQSYLDALDAVEAVENKSHLVPSGFDIGGLLVSGLKISRFNFTGVTEF